MKKYNKRDFTYRGIHVCCKECSQDQVLMLYNRCLHELALGCRKIAFSFLFLLRMTCYNCCILPIHYILHRLKKTRLFENLILKSSSALEMARHRAVILASWNVVPCTL